MHPIGTWLLPAMLAWVPSQGRDAVLYDGIAQDLAAVASEAPLFEGQDGPAKTALLMSSFAASESMFRPDVDEFLPSGLGDHGIAHGLLQVHLRPGERCPDRMSCLRLGRERLRESMAMCRRLPLPDRMAGFTGGACDRPVARAASRWRVERALSWWGDHKYLAPFD